jgi:hypothetical protein
MCLRRFASSFTRNRELSVFLTLVEGIRVDGF